MSTENHAKSRLFLFAGVVLIAGATAICGLLALVAFIFPISNSNEGLISDPKFWPKPFIPVLENSELPASSLTVYGLPRWIDQRSITHLRDDGEFVKALITREGLELTDQSHPKATELRNSVPREWEAPAYENAEWYTTPEFGKTHIEMKDFFLVCRDPVTGVTLILHNNIF